MQDCIYFNKTKLVIFKACSHDIVRTALKVEISGFFFQKCPVRSICKHYLSANSRLGTST